MEKTDIRSAFEQIKKDETLCAKNKAEPDPTSKAMIFVADETELQALIRDLFDEIEKEKRPKWNMKGPMDDDNAFLIFIPSLVYNRFR